MSEMSMVEGYSPLDNTQNRQSRYARLNTMDTGSPYQYHSTMATALDSTSTLATYPEKTPTSERTRGDRTPLVKRTDMSHKYDRETFLRDLVDAQRHLQWEIHSATRTYHRSDGHFYDVEPHVAQARALYLQSLRKIDEESRLALSALGARRASEMARNGEKSKCRKLFEKVRHGVKKWRLEAEVERDQAFVIALFEEVLYARMLYGQAVHGGYYLW